ncbi:MAG TPA: hypothetical protein VL093_04685 [Flavipsychrobacter sp.]|jgi:hypothetical protein|nr:hypothetical protein [Flavipsychrobacter sp.]
MSRNDKHSQHETPDTSVKKEGVTSSFSAATGTPGKYSGEDIETPKGSTGSEEDKTVKKNTPAKNRRSNGRAL